MTSGEIAALVPAIVALLGAAAAWLRAEVANRRVTKHETGVTAPVHKAPGA